MSAQAKESGFERTNPFNNLIFEISFACLALFFLALLKVLSICGGYMTKLYLKVKTSMQWNAAIRMMQEEYITISLACMVKVYAYDFSNFYEGISSAFAACLLFVLLSFPFLITRWLWRIHKQGFLIM